MRIILDGGYVTEDAVTITGVSNATKCVITAASHGYSAGDHIYLDDLDDMPHLNGRTVVAATPITSNSFSIKDLYGNYINSTAYGTYSSGGEASRIYEIDTPYSIDDVKTIRTAQSADVMTICHKSYPIYELSRTGATDWSIDAVDFESAISPPGSVTVVPSRTTTSLPTKYQYVVTAVDRETGDESQASPSGFCTNSVNIATIAGSITVSWDHVPGAKYYNIYKGQEAIGSSPSLPIGGIFGYAGFTYGLEFIDANIVEDGTKTPPKHSDPFAPGRVLSCEITNQGSGYTQAATSATISSATGGGIALTPVVQSGAVVAIIVDNEGHDYTDSDSVVIIGDGSGAEASFELSPESGTYPGIVTYFQQRRVFASTAQQPDTYFMSQPGAYSNYDSSIPVIDSDAIIGTPWATQVNGISAMISMPGGIVILTGGGAWQVSGGQQNASITPSQQTATPQAYNGCSPDVQPMAINYDILYVQEKGSTVYDLSYNFFVNIYTGEDMTVLSSHLFIGKKIISWCWAQEPFKIVWVVQDDGSLLSLTFLKEQEIKGWARHDTQGKFIDTASISEAPIDAVYFITQRYIQSEWRYYIERMDPRLWNTAEDSWCVDCGLATTLEEPDATLTASAKTGSDVTFEASASVFSSGDVGKLIRMGGGKAEITAYVSGTTVTADIVEDIMRIVPSRTNSMPMPALSGEWNLSEAVTTVYGLDHLEGESVAILADGNVLADQVVSDGTLTLDVAASYVIAGLPFQCQLQTLNLDVPGQAATVQGGRKNIYNVKVRLEKTRGIKIGTNQIDATEGNYSGVVEWTGMREAKDRKNSIGAGNAIPLMTGDIEVGVTPKWDSRGKIAIQQDYPLPASVTAIIPDFNLGDESG
jgi:hypothetical protein